MSTRTDLKDDVVREPGRETPIVDRADVLVVGGSPTGVAAAVAAARNGAKVLLVERLGFLGGQATHVAQLSQQDLVSPATNERLVGGFVTELIERMASLDGGQKPERILRHDEILSNREYITKKSVSWTLDREVLKYVLLQMVQEAEVRLLLHTFVVGAIVDGNTLKGIIVENKGGRQAILAKVVVDATGDGDVVAHSGTPYELRSKEERFGPGGIYWIGNVEVEKTLEYFRKHPNDVRLFPPTIADADNQTTEDMLFQLYIISLDELEKMAIEKGDLEYVEGIHCGSSQKPLPFVSYRVPIGARYYGKGVFRVMANFEEPIDCLSATDLTYAEVQMRKHFFNMISFFRRYLPGFESANIIDTHVCLPVRETRITTGEYCLTGDDILNGRTFPDSIGKSGGHDESYRIKRGHDIPYRCLIPKKVDNLLVAGRCISSSVPTAHNSTRSITSGMVTGQGAGTAAALSARANVTPRQLDVPELREALKLQGVIL